MIQITEVLMKSKVQFYFSVPLEIGYTAEFEAMINENKCRYLLVYVPEEAEKWELRIGHLLNTDGTILKFDYDPLYEIREEIVNETIKLFPEINEQLHQRRGSWERYQSLSKDEVDQALAQGEFKDLKEDIEIF